MIYLPTWMVDFYMGFHVGIHIPYPSHGSYYGFQHAPIYSKIISFPTSAWRNTPTPRHLKDRVSKEYENVQHLALSISNGSPGSQSMSWYVHIVECIYIYTNIMGPPKTYIFRGFLWWMVHGFLGGEKTCIFPWFWGLMVYIYKSGDAVDGDRHSQMLAIGIRDCESSNIWKLRHHTYCWWFRNPKQPPGMYRTL